MKQMNSIFLSLIVISFLTNIAAAMQPTPDITQYPEYQMYQMATVVIIIAISIIVIAIAYVFSDKKLVIKSLKDIYNFLRNNPSIFLIGLILSVILLAVTIGIDSLKPAPPSPEDFGGLNIDYHLAASKYFIGTLPFIIIGFIISFLINTYFTAVFYCFIKNPVMGDSFSKARRFYIRLLLFSLLLFVLIILLYILMVVIFFIVTLIIGAIILILSSISPWLSIILSIILYLILYITIMVVSFAAMLKIIFAIPIIVYENKGVIYSVKGSWNLTKGVLLSIFVVSIIATIVFLLLPMIVLIFSYSIPTSQYLFNFLMYLLLPVSYTATAMLYFNIRKKKE